MLLKLLHVEGCNVIAHINALSYYFRKIKPSNFSKKAYIISMRGSISSPCD